MEVANKFLRKGSSTARISGGSTVATPAAHISLIPSFTLGSLAVSLPSLCLLSSLLGHPDQSRQRQRGSEDEADKRGFEEQRKG